MSTPSPEHRQTPSGSPPSPASQERAAQGKMAPPTPIPMARVPLGRLVSASVDLAEGLTIIGLTTRPTLRDRTGTYGWLLRIINANWFRSLFPELQGVQVSVSEVDNLRGWTIEVKAAPAAPEQAQALARRLLTTQVDVPAALAQSVQKTTTTARKRKDANPPWLWAVVGGLALALVGAMIFIVGGARTSPAPESTATTVTVPSVVGFTVTDATRNLEEVGLTVGDIREQPSDQPQGVILQQSPRNGEIVATGSRVSLVIAGAAEPVVPDMVGLSQTEATNALLQAGFRLGNIETQDSAKPVGTVIEQTPAAGNTAAKDTPVDIVLSTGIVSVPPVVGFSEAEAVALLEDAGFMVKTQTQPSSQVGVVIAQSPEAGAKLEVGKTIVITVGAETPSSPSPSPSPSESAP